MASKSVNVGVIGFGTVGSGTVKVLLKNADVLGQRLGFDIKLLKVADKDLESDRGIELPEGMLVPDADEVLEHPDIHVVVELVGGTGIAPVPTAKNFPLLLPWVNPLEVSHSSARSVAVLLTSRIKLPPDSRSSPTP